MREDERAAGDEAVEIVRTVRATATVPRSGRSPTARLEHLGALLIKSDDLVEDVLRWTTTLPALGFFTERSNVPLSMSETFTVQDFGESACVFCNAANSARSLSLRGFVFPRLRRGSSW